MSVDEHLAGKPDVIRETYDRLMLQVNAFGRDVTLNPVKSSIQVKVGATFMSIKPKRQYIEIEFQYADEIEQLPVFKAFKVSHSRAINFVRLENPSDVTKKLLGWLKKSYLLVKG